MHRIDRDTSGLVVFAKSPQAHENLKEQFFRREPKRIYQAIVYGCPKPDSGRWLDHLFWDQSYLVQRPVTRSYEGAKEASSHYRNLERFAFTTLIEVSLVTGKRHQIRVQAALRGHQLVGEKKYLSEKPPRRLIEFERQALHARRLEFQHPASERWLEFDAPLPADFKTLVDQLKKS